MATQVASLTGLLALDDRDWIRGLKNADSGMTSLADKVDVFAAKVSSVGVELTAMTQPLRDFGKQGIDVASKFDSAMTEISARTGIVGKDLDSVRNFALQMGADTAFSSQQAADAFLQLLTSGQNATEAMKTLPAILDAAAASGEDLGSTADVITDIMASFGLGVEDAADVVDVLAKAAGASSADMGSLGQGFANVGGIAKQFGLSVEDTASILAVFSENGIKGAEAGTALKSMLLNMTRPTENVQKAWNKLGISFYDAQGNARPLNTVMEEMKKAMDKLPAEEQNKLMTELAGSYGVVGLSALMGSISIDDMQAAMAGSASASDVASARMNTFEGAMDSLGGSIETLQIVALTPFIDNVLKPMAQTITEVINQVTAWATANPELTSTIVAILAVVATAGPVLLALGGILSGVGTVVGLLSGAIAFLVSPIGIAIGAVAALGAAYVTNFGGIRDFVDTQIRPRLEAFFGWLGMVWETTIKPGLEALYTWFTGTALPTLATYVQTQVLPKVQEFFNFIAGVWTVLEPALTSFYNWFVTDALPAIRDFIVNEVAPKVETFFNFIAGVWEIVSTGLGSFLDWFTVSGLPAIQAFIENNIQPVVEDFINILKGIWTVVKPGFDALASGVQKVLGPIITTLNDIINKIAAIGGGESKLSTEKKNSTGGLDRLQGTLANRDSGGSGQPNTPYMIGTGAQPELFVPKTAGDFYPAGAQGGRNYTINVQVDAATVNDTANLSENARNFGTALMDALKANGG